MQPSIRPENDCEVRRLTDLAEHCHHPYFYCTTFTPDARRILVVTRRDGVAEARLLDLRTGEAEPLVSRAGLEEFMISLSPDGRYLFYIAGPELHRLELETHHDEVVWRLRAPWDGWYVYPGFSADFRTMLVAQMHRDDVVDQTTGWSFFEPQWRARPRCRLVLVDLETGQEQLIHEDACWLGHPQICPGDPTKLMFCHEGPGHLIDARLWRIDVGGAPRCVGYHETEPGAGAPTLITHECFMPDGQSFAYLHIEKEQRQAVRVRFRNVDTFELTGDFEVNGYLHIGPSPDGRWMAADERAGNPADSGIWLMNTATGVERRLCAHGSSYACRGKSTQDAHPHPMFSPDGRHVLFTSDRETSPDGNCAVYLATIPEDLP